MTLLACKNYRIIACANSYRNARLNLHKLIQVFNPFITKKAVHTHCECTITAYYCSGRLEILFAMHNARCIMQQFLYSHRGAFFIYVKYIIFCHIHKFCLIFADSGDTIRHTYVFCRLFPIEKFVQ